MYKSASSPDEPTNVDPLDKLRQAALDEFGCSLLDEAARLTRAVLAAEPRSAVAPDPDL